MMYCFRKMKTVTKEEYIMIFEQGEIQKPIIVLSENDIEELNDEWKKKVHN